MIKHISYPKTEQFRNIVSTINRQADFAGLDKDSNPIYDRTLKKPVLTFRGTVKLHGTNASVCYNKKNGLWTQSRNNVITVEKDNAGFAFFVDSRKNRFQALVNKILERNNIDPNEFTISLYGEWAGKGIQKNVGISELDKAFYIFGAKISKPEDEEFASYWVGSEAVRDNEVRIYNIEDFPIYHVTVDFNHPESAQNEFIAITEAVEKECPVAKSFGIENGLGEGVVWSTTYKDTSYRFKVKGEKHSVSKVKTLAAVDVEKVNSIKEFVEYAVTENRVEQAIGNVVEDKNDFLKKTGDVIRWVINDILAEEKDVLVENGLEPKEVNKYISARAKEIYFEKMKI